MVVAHYAVKFRQLAKNDDGLGFVDVVERNYSHDLVPYIVGELEIDAGRYGLPRRLMYVSITDDYEDGHELLSCDRGYLDLEAEYLNDIELLLQKEFLDANWFIDNWRRTYERVQLPVRWIEHKVRRSPWSDVLVDAGQEVES